MRERIQRKDDYTMKVTRIDINPELKLLTNLIVSDQFCKEIIPILNPTTLKSPFSKILCEWIAEYYSQFQKAPYKNIKDIYRTKKKTLMDNDEHENISTFLTKLSSDWESTEPNNIDYSINEAIQYLKTRSSEYLIEQLQLAVDAGDTAKAEQYIANYKRIEKTYGEGVSILHDTSEITSAFIEEDESLFVFKGAMGEVMGSLGRGDFLSFIAPMKRGKTFMLWYTAEVAMHHSLKVVFFTLEMTKKQMIRRAWQSLSGSPRRNSTVTIPYFEKTDDDIYCIETREEERKGIDPTMIVQFQKKLRSRNKKGDVRIIALPAYSADVNDIVSHLDNLEHYQNYIPDVVIIDYADIVAPTKGFRGEYRHQLDDIWKRLRKLAQERNILMVTATQAEKSSFHKDITQLHVAEDIRKLAHVTCMIAINQNVEEAKKGVARLSQIGIREGKHQFRQAVILQCLDIGRPCIASKFRDEVEPLKGEIEEKEFEKKRG
jgi:hypothetical protein